MTALPPTMAIVGAGASGTLLAVHALRRARQPLRIVLFDRRSAPGRGVAYSTREPLHLLNVRAGSMSAFPDAPRDFVDWLNADAPSAPVAPADFVSRLRYAAYLEATLAAAQADAQPGVTFEVQPHAVVGLEPDSSRLRLDTGQSFHAERVVLALGNFAPRTLASLVGSSPGLDGAVFDNPWDAQAVEGLTGDEAILIVGTGLTMVDVVVSLAQRRSHTGPIHVLSRRGLLPQIHPEAPNETDAAALADLPNSARALLREVRARAEQKTRAGGDWRAVIDGLRPATQAAWQRAPLAERERFLRHVQPYWDTHRHRIAPQVGRIITEAVRDGQLRVWTGRLMRLEPGPSGVRATLRLRHGGQHTLEVARAINGTGPATNIRNIDDPLLTDLLARGAACQDPLGLGFATTADGRLLDARGEPSRYAFSLGPMRRGELWETTAVPDIRGQAAQLAEVLLTELGVGG